MTSFILLIVGSVWFYSFLGFGTYRILEKKFPYGDVVSIKFGAFFWPLLLAFNIVVYLFINIPQHLVYKLENWIENSATKRKNKAKKVVDGKAPYR